MKKCPFCAEDIQDAAIVCKHCGRDLPRATKRSASWMWKEESPDESRSTSAATTTSTRAAAPGPSTPGQKAGIGCVVVLLLMFGGCWLILNSPETQRKKAADNSIVIVTVLCEDAVRKRLRAPASADFPFGDATNVEPMGNDRYLLRSHVDAQNAFGAKLRKDFVCTVEGSGENATGYKITGLTGLD